jgi:hypothetical protein
MEKIFRGIGRQWRNQWGSLAKGWVLIWMVKWRERERERERERKELLRKIKILENKAELRGLSEEDWVERYKLEGQLEDIFAYEEHVW